MKTQTKLRTAWLAGSLALLLAGLATLYPTSDPKLSPPRGAPASDQARLPGVTWPEGLRLTYAAAYRSDDMVRPIVDGQVDRMVAEPMQSSLQVDLTLAFTGTGPGPNGGALVRMDVVGCEGGTLTAVGQTVWTGAEACAQTLGGHSLLAEVMPNGRVHEVYDDATVDATVRTLLQQLLLRTQVSIPRVLPAGGAWLASEHNVPGVASNVYRAETEADPDGTWHVTRRTTGYHQLLAAQAMAAPPRVTAQGDARIALDARGVLTEVDGTESLVAETTGGVVFQKGQTSFAFRLIEQVETQLAVDLSRYQRRPAHEVAAGHDANARLLDKQIDGLTLADLKSTLAQYGSGGTVPDHARFLWRAAGLLTKHPTYADELLPLYRAQKASPQLKGLVLDLLASAGHPDAQRVMRTALADDDALHSESGAGRQLFQRMGFLAAPDEHTVAFVEEQYRQAHNGAEDIAARRAQMTAAYSLGAVAGKLADGDEDEQARAHEINQMLVDDLQATSDPKLLVHRITALSNTRLSSNITLFEGLADHPSSRVRQRVADGLAEASQGAEAPAGLLALLEDADPLVQRSALHGLPATPLALERLAAVAAAGKIAQANVRPTLSVVQKGRAAHREATDDVLHALIGAGIEDKLSRAAAYRLLEM